MSNVLYMPTPRPQPRVDVVLEFEATELAAMTTQRRTSMLERLFAVGLTPREILDELA